MKLLHKLSKSLYTLIFFFFLFASCNNKNGLQSLSEDIPIRLKATISDVIYTRIASNSFEPDDAVGLFAFANDNTIQEDRYGNNVRFTRNSSDYFITDEAFYYPADGEELQLISYYPYQEIGVRNGESTMSVSVSSEQNIPVNYSMSDFLIAIKKNVKASKEAIPLNYNHKFSCINIAIEMGADDDLDAVLAAKPKITFHGFYTKGDYDFITDLFSKFTEEKSISVASEWKISDGKLVGGEVILIPQELVAGNQYISLEVNGREHTTFFPSNLLLQSGKQRGLEITYSKSEDILLSRLTGEISDWIDAGSDKVDTEPMHNYIDITKLTFAHSDVYKVNNKEKQVAEICKEYLVSTGFSSQAIVAYPMKDDGRTDLSKGLVVKLIGKDGKVHGGTASWNSELNTLTYTPGTRDINKNIYILNKGQLALSISQAGDALPVVAISDIVRDVRGSVISTYPIVKIGTQYWIKNNFHASTKRNGEKLTLLSEMTEGASGYLMSSPAYDSYFYTSDVALSNDFLPTGWKLPDWNAWNQLKSYINDEASVLKSGTWIPSKNNGFVAPVTNLSGFNALPAAFFAGKEQRIYEGKYVSYWALDSIGKQMSDKMFSLQNELEGVAEGNVSVIKAFPIRCVRK